MQVRVADPADVEPARRLMTSAPRQQIDLNIEGVELAIQQKRCLVLEHSASERKAEDVLLALFLIAFEETPAPAGEVAPQRVFLQGMAFQRHVSPTDALRLLLHELIKMLDRTQPHLVIAYSRQGWLDRALHSVGMEQADRVEFFSLEGLQKRRWPQAVPATPCVVRQADRAEVDALTMVDACAFEPLWRYSRRQMQESLDTGSVLVAQVGDQPVGYMAFQVLEETCLLVRLAVLPDWRGQGIGRTLFGEALLQAQRQGCTRAVLNTQASNRRSQQLYQAFGFRPTGESFTVFTLALPATSDLSLFFNQVNLNETAVDDAEATERT